MALTNGVTFERIDSLTFIIIIPTHIAIPTDIIIPTDMIVYTDIINNTDVDVDIDIELGGIHVPRSRRTIRWYVR